MRSGKQVNRASGRGNFAGFGSFPDIAVAVLNLRAGWVLLQDRPLEAAREALLHSVATGCLNKDFRALSAASVCRER